LRRREGQESRYGTRGPSDPLASRLFQDDDGLPAKKYIRPYIGINADNRAFNTEEFLPPRMIPIIELPKNIKIINQCQIDTESICPSQLVRQFVGLKR
jgi:hypothetical protein